ncbi:MAG: helix-turn-helix transcriptional regulator, partial [Acidimicrobiaceae bacterium]|nr:helix-turn-helix transcriptional regulator [Acidimicrobiaceae bacterium]
TQVQMKDVAAEAGVALGTVYRYFQSKDHLLAEALATWARQLRTQMERRPLAGTTNAERLTDVLHRSMRAFQGWPQLAKVVMALESSSDPFTREIFARNNAETMAVYAEALQDLPHEAAVEVLRVAAAVFDLQLRRWIVGIQSIAEAYDRIARGMQVIFEFSDPGGAGADSRR